MTELPDDRAQREEDYDDTLDQLRYENRHLKERLSALIADMQLCIRCPLCETDIYVRAPVIGCKTESTATTTTISNDCEDTNGKQGPGTETPPC